MISMGMWNPGMLDADTWQPVIHRYPGGNEFHVGANWIGRIPNETRTPIRMALGQNCIRDAGENRKPPPPHEDMSMPGKCA